jgi:ribonuclease HI
MFAFTDGACRQSNPGICSAAFVVLDGDVEIARQGKYLGPELHTNNFAEYQGLLMLLHWAYDVGVKGLLIHCDSLLVVKQVAGEWNARTDLAQYTREAQALMLHGGHSMKHVRGHQDCVGNILADQICNYTLDAEHPREKKDHSVFLE